MEKYHIYNVIDALICIGLGNDILNKQFYKQIENINEDEWKKIWEIVNIQQIWEITYQGIKKLINQTEIKIPVEIYRKFIYMEKLLTVQYYQMFSFTTYVQELLEKDHIPYYVLKGIVMDSLYPHRGMRKITDLDIYIPQKKYFKQINKILERENFKTKKEIWDYHKSCYKSFGEKEYLFEIHSRIAGRMGRDFRGEQEIYRMFLQSPYKPDYYEALEHTFPALKAKDFAFNLLLHMMNHMLGEKLYFCMLCDWTVFWNKKGKEVDSEEFRELLNKSGLQRFAFTVTKICIEHFGLDKKAVEWFRSDENLDGADKILYNKIIQDTKQNSGNVNVLSILCGDQPWYVIGFKEMHRQMKYRFPRLKKLFVLWPLLWSIVIGIYMYNNKVLNREHLIQTFQKENEKKLLFEKIGLADRGKR